MEKKHVNTKFDFHVLASECLLDLERYKLKVNLIGINLRKEDYMFKYDYLTKKINKKYAFITERLK